MEELLGIARNISKRYVNLNDDELVLFSTILKRVELKKGEHLISIGEIAHDTYWVETGLLRQFYYKEDREVTEHFASEEQGMMCIQSLFQQVPSHLTIEALEKSVVYRMSYPKLVELSEKHVVFGTLLRKLFEFVLVMSQEKADSWRFETAKERYDRFMVAFPEAAKRASINHIASYLLMTPETLSRIRAGKG